MVDTLASFPFFKSTNPSGEIQVVGYLEPDVLTSLTTSSVAQSRKYIPPQARSVQPNRFGIKINNDQIVQISIRGIEIRKEYDQRHRRQIITEYPGTFILVEIGDEKDTHWIQKADMETAKIQTLYKGGVDEPSTYKLEIQIKYKQTHMDIGGVSKQFETVYISRYAESGCWRTWFEDNSSRRSMFNRYKPFVPKQKRTFIRITTGIPTILEFEKFETDRTTTTTTTTTINAVLNDSYDDSDTE